MGFAAGPLSQPGATLVVDLSACDYLDSTFPGCLVDMQRRAGRSEVPTTSADESGVLRSAR